MAYIGQEPGQGQAERFIFTASGGETTVTADDDGLSIGYTENQVSVYLNGVKLVVGTDCIATNGSTITGLSALSASDVVEVIALSAFSPADTVPKTGGTFTGNVIMSGNLTVNGTETIVNTQTLTVEDKNIEMGKVASPTDTTADGGGITLKGTTDKTIIWENDTDSWNFNQNIETSTTTKIKQKGAFMQSSTHQALTLGA
jgi:hypothetical protein